MTLIDRDLTDEQILYRTRQHEDLVREVEEWNIEIDRGMKILEHKIPERQIRSKINELKMKIDIHEKNIKVLEKQIREKKEKVYQDEEVK